MNELRTTPLFGNRLTPLDVLFRSLSHVPVEEDIPIQVDVREEDGGYRLHADLPGSAKEDIAIDIDGNEVTVSASRNSNREVKEGERLVLSERRFGKNSRSFRFPVEIDREGAKASHRDGVLEVFLPKKTATARSTVKID